MIRHTVNRVLLCAQIQSDRNISFDKKPNMQSEKIAAAAVAALKSGKYNQVRCKELITGNECFLAQEEAVLWGSALCWRSCAY